MESCCVPEEPKYFLIFVHKFDVFIMHFLGLLKIP